MSRVVRVGAAQLGPVTRREDRTAVVERLCTLLHAAADDRCDLVVFPEAALTAFFPHWHIEDPAERRSYFEPAMPAGPVERLFREAAERHVGFYLGYAEEAVNDTGTHYFNASILVAKDGAIIGKYRKIHLPGDDHVRPDLPFQNLERCYFEVGDLGFPVFDAFGGRIGMLICNDRRWPEAYRVLGLQGVELIALGYNTPFFNPDADQSPQLRMFHNELCMQAGAYQNATWVVGVAKAGMEEGVDMMAGSCIIKPTGEIIAQCKTSGDELVVADCDLDACNQGKRSEFDLANNRRPEHYGPLVARP